MARRSRQSAEPGAPAAPAPRKLKPTGEPWLTPDRLFIGGSLILTVIIVGAIAFSSMQQNSIRTVQIDGVQVIPGLTASHTESAVSYANVPPAGGAHHPAWQSCGVYVEPLKNEHAVHSLEHGAVWITYQPDLPLDQVRILQDLTQRSTHRLLSPYPGIESPIVATAWGYQLPLTDANDPRLMQFINKYEQGPQTLEPGATCSGGQTRTLAQLGG
jgi:hypothetical protein